MQKNSCRYSASTNSGCKVHSRDTAVTYFHSGKNAFPSDDRILLTAITHAFDGRDLFHVISIRPVGPLHTAHFLVLVKHTSIGLMIDDFSIPVSDAGFHTITQS